MSKSKVKPAFPGRSNSMGYEAGLTKLEWIVTQLVASGYPDRVDVDDAIALAQTIIENCNNEEKED
jgi:hypothetical protein